MKKTFLLLFAALLTCSTALAHEGMWLLNKLKQINEADMQRLGFKLTAEDIYDINKSGLKDAVIRLGGGFCSGEMVSAEGLFLTNHHCGYDAVQSLSSVEHDYLTNGFWAMTRKDEAPAGFNVSFLQRIDDVTDRVLKELTDDMSEADRQAKIAEVAQTLEKEAAEGNGLSASLKTMFEGNEFYIFVYKTYRDVRLVGAPPSAIGKFGGDTDNWMWPRHTGDFSMFRVYTGPDGEPADPNEANIPFKPKWHFPVSLNGVKEGDFAMVMGYPGSTDRFLSSQGVKLALDIEQPSRVKIRAKKLEIYKQHMDASNEVRIKYAAKDAQVSNYWKYFIGQQRGLKRLHVYDKKKAQEDELMAWVNADAGRKAKYGEIVALLDKGYAERTKAEKASTYMQEAAFGSEVVLAGLKCYGLLNQLREDPKNSEKVAANVAKIQAAAEEFWKDYDPATDQEVTAAMFRMIHADVEPALHPSVMKTIQTKYKGDFDAWAKAMFSTSFLTDRKRLDAFLAKPTLKAMEKDLGMQLMESCINHYRGVIGPMADAPQADIDKGYRLMVAAMREKEPNKMWYPNANSTMRLTYGVVGAYTPGDAMIYKHTTTAAGILEKEDNTNDEFIVPKRQHELLSKKDYGRYADENGDLITCFISNNDITGGNSGSPVINGNGELIGIAFDGNWEAMSGDIAFEPELQRTISVDIRYVLWTIDKFAGATHLVNEMTLVQGTKEEVKAEAVPVPSSTVLTPVKN
ncbi:MAG: S46 family peptidase [Flavobacteriales bacterium]|nr:S46 family peptidase [Flavobacteriales bacterium]MBP6696332.1 S46 family peptidase [Flavobacteriales bacterium]